MLADRNRLLCTFGNPDTDLRAVLEESGPKNEFNGMVRVRRERRLVHSGCKSHPGTGSFRPVAIGAAVEVTKLLKPPVEEGRKGDSASVQAVT